MSQFKNGFSRYLGVKFRLGMNPNDRVEVLFIGDKLNGSDGVAEEEIFRNSRKINTPAHEVILAHRQ